MVSEDEQIRAILSSPSHILRWAASQLPQGQTLSDRRYSDFIRVTRDDVVRYARQHGFPSRLVYESADGSYSSPGPDDHLCIVHDASGRRPWAVFYSERGQNSEYSYFTTQEEAYQEVANRIIQNVKFLLNANYRHAHPELNLPPPTEME